MTLLYEPFAPLFARFARFAPAADVIVTDDDVTVVMDVPGLKAEDLTIELQDDVLSVRGERGLPYAESKDEDRRTWRHLERGFGKFERVLRVPRGLDPDSIIASMADGVLTLVLPKPDIHKPRRIQIGTEAQP